ncbi:MAG: hypothetical protein AAF436_11755 [Myxococcota bacterium]
MSEQTWVLVSFFFASFIMILGGWGVFAPRSIIAFIESWSTKLGLWLAVVLRLSFAVVLWVVAPLSRTPELLQALAVLSGGSGLLLPLLGLPRFKRFVGAWGGLPTPVLRLWCLVAVALGVFVFWSTARPIVIRVPDPAAEVRVSADLDKKSV